MPPATWPATSFWISSRKLKGISKSGVQPCLHTRFCRFPGEPPWARLALASLDRRPARSGGHFRGQAVALSGVVAEHRLLQALRHVLAPANEADATLHP